MLNRNGVDMNKAFIIVYNTHIEILLAPQENNPLEYLRTHDRYEKSDLPKGRFRAPLQIVISLLIWTYLMEELFNIFDRFTKK